MVCFLKVRVEEFSEKDERWDKLMEVAPQSTIFHQFDWLRIMEKYTNTKLVCLVGLNGDEIFAAVPFFYEDRYGGFLRKLTSPPYPTGVPSLGFVFPNSHKLRQSRCEHLLVNFQEELERYMRSKIKPNSIFISTSPDLVDIRPFLWAGYSAIPRYTYIGDIRDGSLVWKKFNKTVRKNITKAEKSGIIIEEGGEREYNLIVELLEKRYRNQGMKFDLPRDYLREIYYRFHQKNLRIFVCNWKGERVGGLVVLVYKNKFLFWLGGVSLKMEETYPNYLLFWKLMEWARSRGLEYFDLIGANTPSINKFKSQFGFDLKVYFWLQKSTLRHKLALNTIKLLKR